MLMGDQDNIGANQFSYVQGFSDDVRDIFERFEFAAQVDRLFKSGLLYQVVEKFTQIDLHPTRVDNHQMGLIFEELIRRFSELSNETAGEHFPPREVIRLMVNLMFVEDDDVLSKPGVVRTIYDPTAGTGGMLSVAGEYLASHNDRAALVMFGQELNPESYAICKADMLIKGQDVSKIKFGNTLSDDGLPGHRFDYMLSNPPFGVEWKKVEKTVRAEAEQKGFSGRIGPGLPRVSDGSLLFLMLLLSKMRAARDGGSRFGIVLSGSPLFTGGAGSGESEIRRYVLEKDLVEAIIALPTDMFYNTGIASYVWVLTNRKPATRRGRVQLIDGSSFWQKMRKALAPSGRKWGTTILPPSPACSVASIPPNLPAALTPRARNWQRPSCLTVNPRPVAASSWPRCRASLPMRRSAIAPFLSSGHCAMRRARSCWAPRASRRASPNPTAPCAIPKTCRWPRM